MRGTWLERLRDRLRSAWAVFTGRAYAAYSVPDVMSEVRLRAASLTFLGEFDAFWSDGRFVPHANAEAYSYLLHARDVLETELGER